MQNFVTFPHQINQSYVIHPPKSTFEQIINSFINLADMETDQSEKRRKNYTLMRSVMDYGMGLVILGCGVFFAIAPRLGIEFNSEPVFRYFFAGLCMIYGAWRIYRGYKKNYFSANDK